MEIRRPDPAVDFDEVLALIQACDRAVYGDSDWTAAELRQEWDGLDLAHDAWLAVDDGRIAGSMAVYELGSGRVLADGYVHPELTGRGVGTRLLAVAEERALELTPRGAGRVTRHDRDGATSSATRGRRSCSPAAGTPTSAPSTAWCSTSPRAERPEPVWPAGLELRPFERERDGRRVHAAIEEAFTDEWGHEPRRLRGLVGADVRGGAVRPAALARRLGRRRGRRGIAELREWLGDWGFVRQLGVRPAWRQQGLGLALLHESFRRFAERGETTAALGVDSENPTGATRLYERAGMRILWRADVWRKELRPSG